MSSVPCAVCGCVDFTKQSGFFICNNCDTQSQDIQEQTFEYFADDPKLNVIEEKEELISHKKEDQHKLTSWECYNIILKGLVDQLIDLGANPDLKVVTLQLWATYLKKGQIAFFSKNKDKFPALPACFKSKDVEILYGIRNLRRILFQDVFSYRRHRPLNKKQKSEGSDGSDASDNTNISLRSLRVKQRRLAVSKLNDESAMNDSASIEVKSAYATSDSEDASKIHPDADTLESIDETRKRKSKGRLKIAFKSSARKALEDAMRFIKELKSKQNDESVSSQMKRTMRNRLFKVRRNNLGGINVPVNISIVFSILRVALLLLEDDIQLADLLRWCCEGRLSLNKPEKFIPVKLLNIPPCELTSASRAGFQLDIKNVTTFLQLEDIPTPNLHKLVERYCADLCLPNDFVKFIHGLMAVFSPQMNFAFYANRVFPDYEYRAMAYILFAFKLLFSLDDVTEVRQSEFAEAVNKCNADKKIQDIPVLFSWTSWVKFIECRKAILSKYDVGANQLNYREYPVDENVVLSYWNKVKPEDRKPDERNPFGSVLRTQLESSVKQLKRDYVKTEAHDIPEFPVSFTPLKTNAEYLLTNYPDSVSESARQILCNNFPDYSVKYILNQEWATDIARRLELEFQLIDGIADVETIDYELPESDIPVISKSSVIPAHINIAVEIENDREKYMKSKAKKLPRTREFHPTFETFNSTSSERNGPRSKGLSIYSPWSKYWFFHECGRRVSYEMFNTLAEENFPYSFSWLLRECACILRAERKDLYFELVVVESVLYSMFDDHSYAQKVPVVLYANEW